VSRTRSAPHRCARMVARAQGVSTAAAAVAAAAAAAANSCVCDGGWDSCLLLAGPGTACARGAAAAAEPGAGVGAADAGGECSPAAADSASTAAWSASDHPSAVTLVGVCASCQLALGSERPLDGTDGPAGAGVRRSRGRSATNTPCACPGPHTREQAHLWAPRPPAQLQAAAAQ
jgi:hypothetical protein